jgi:4-diphosphocytidyl-2-C-methyl-D-erythritol kinase
MTGTGACVFAMFETETDAEQVFRQLPTKWRAFIAKGVDRSPLIDALNARLEQYPCTEE